MNESDSIRLHHIWDAANEALSFVGGRSKEAVLADRVLVLALCREIEIIGEAASKISSEFRQGHQEIAWPAIIAMRIG
jgi:uncharacterized protein with HEPN domain